MACKKLKFVGRDVVLEYAIKCPEEMPEPNEWRRIGSLRTKDLSITWDTADATDSDSIGYLRENLATFQSMTISGDGTVKASGTGAADLIALVKHVISPSLTGGEPTAWLRMTFPDLTFIAYMVINDMSRSAPYDDVVTYSLEAMATSSDFGLIVEDTPDPDAPDVETVTVQPETMSLDIGTSEQASVTVTPATAPQGVVWASSDTEVATVDQNGLVSAVGEGTATVTATSMYDVSKSGEIAVTVAGP